MEELNKKKEEFERFKYEVWTKKTDESSGKYGKMLRLISVVEYHEILDEVWQWIEQELIKAKVDGEFNGLRRLRDFITELKEKI